MSRREKSLKSTKINADLKKIQHRRPKFRGLVQGGRLTNPSAWPKQAGTDQQNENWPGPSQEQYEPQASSSSPTQQEDDHSQSFDASYIQLDDQVSVFSDLAYMLMLLNYSNVQNV